MSTQKTRATDELCEAALSAILQEAAQVEIEVLFVLIGGSYAEGIASAVSDIDFVVVHKGGRAPKLLARVLTGVRIEAMVYSIDDYAKVVEMPRQGSAGASFFWQIDMRRRLLCSKPVFGHKAHAEQMEKASVVGFLDDLLEFQQSLAFKSFADLKATLFSQLGEDDMRIRCRAHVEHSADLLLSSLCDYYIREKYRLARLRRTLVDARLQTLLDALSSILSGRGNHNGSDSSFDTWLRSAYVHATISQYLAVFSSFWPTFITEIDIENIRTHLKLTSPIGIFRKGSQVICQSTTAAFSLSPELANAVALTLLGLPNSRVLEASKAYQKQAPSQDLSTQLPLDELQKRAQVVIERLSDKQLTSDTPSLIAQTVS